MTELINAWVHVVKCIRCLCGLRHMTESRSDVRPKPKAGRKLVTCLRPKHYTSLISAPKPNFGWSLLPSSETSCTPLTEVSGRLRLGLLGDLYVPATRIKLGMQTLQWAPETWNSLPSPFANHQPRSVPGWTQTCSSAPIHIIFYLWVLL